MAEFASNAKGNAALTTGIIGTSLSGLLASGFNPLSILGMGGRSTCESDHVVTRYDLGKENEIAQLKVDKALLESNIFTDSKITEVYEKLSGKIDRVEGSVNCRIDGINAQLAQQAVYNATNTANLNCLQGQVADMLSLSKRIIPANSVCPAPMPQYNSWTAPTAA